MKILNTISKNWSGSLFVFLLGLLTIPIHAQIYVANYGGSTIDEYNLDGSVIDYALIQNLSHPTSLAVLGNDLYEVNSYNGSVGEYTTSGGTVNASLISGLGLGVPWGLAISGSTLYVSQGHSIETYSLSGTPINTSFITGLADARDIAISGNDLFVVNAGGAYSTIGDYNATTGALINSSVVGNLPNAVSLAVSGNDLYTVNYDLNAVSEYTTSGTLINATLISGTDPQGLEVVGNDLYVTNEGVGVGKYNATTGAAINSGLITNTTGQPIATAVVVTPEPSTWALLLSGFGILAFWRIRKKGQT